MRRIHSSVMLGAALLLVVCLGTTASGYWTAGGLGTGTEPTATAQDVTLSPATTGSTLHPGAESALSVTVTNPNAFPVRLTSLALDTAQGNGGYAVDAGHAGCTGGSLAFAPQDNGGSGWTLDAGTDTTLHLGGALSMGLGASNACQGATFTVHLTAGP